MCVPARLCTPWNAPAPVKATYHYHWPHPWTSWRTISTFPTPQPTFPAPNARSLHPRGGQWRRCWFCREKRAREASFGHLVYLLDRQISHINGNPILVPRKNRRDCLLIWENCPCRLPYLRGGRPSPQSSAHHGETRSTNSLAVLEFRFVVRNESLSRGVA